MTAAAHARIDRRDTTKSEGGWSPPRLIFYALLPGAANLVVFLPLAWLLRDSGVPAMTALFGAILLGEVPVSWGLMLHAARAEGHGVSLAWLFPWRRRQGAIRLLIVGLPLAVGGMIAVFGLASAAEPVIRGSLFEWVPEWMTLTAGPAGMAGASRGGLLVVWALSGVVGVIVGGMTQELYHRGFLLPRTSHLGWWAVPFNGILFAVAHLAAPWGWPFFFVAGSFWGAAVYRWKSIQLGLVGHVGMLAIGWFFMTLSVFGVLPA